MLVVTDVKIAEVPRGYMEHEVFTFHEAVICNNAVDPTQDRVRVTRDQIRGRPFEHHGRTYVIGWSRNVQDALGIPFEAYDDMQQRIQQLEYENRKLTNELIKLRPI